jgi:hypothetical protein
MKRGEGRGLRGDGDLQKYMYEHTAGAFVTMDLQIPLLPEMYPRL